MMFKNPEIKKLYFQFLLSFIVSMMLVSIASNTSLGVIQSKIMENNQAIIGNVLVKYPELETEIIDIVTQGTSKENIEIGKKVLEKYNYNESIEVLEEPIVNSSYKEIEMINTLLVILIFIVFLGILTNFLRNIYSEIRDMGSYVYNSIEGISYNMKKQNQDGDIGILKTELIKMTSSLKENISLLKSEKLFLNNTISDISHQLKTPMTSLIVLNDLMYDDIPYEVKIDFLDKIKTQLNKMEWLIKSMLKLSKVEAKIIDYDKKQIKIKELIYRSIENFNLQMDIKEIDLKIVGKEDVSIYADINWMTEALSNIIKNCIEHSSIGSELLITYNENPIYSEIIIKDSGEGIDKKDIKHLFKRFYKGNNSKKEDSVGIGLAISKSIIEEHNGSINVKSKKDVGTEFIITIHKSYSD